MFGLSTHSEVEERLCSMQHKNNQMHKIWQVSTGSSSFGALKIGHFSNYSQ